MTAIGTAPQPALDETAVAPLDSRPLTSSGADSGAELHYRRQALTSYRAARDARIARRDWTGAVGAGEWLSCLPLHEAIEKARAVLQTLEAVELEERGVMKGRTGT